jgi:bleomycin hydrolase
MKKLNIFLLICAFTFAIIPAFCKAGGGQNNDDSFQFTYLVKIPTTSVKDQSSTGTCWSYATTSFIETELIRMGKDSLDLSEMFFVRYAYAAKAESYIRYQGNANFSEGGQAHDVMNILRKQGMVPEKEYTGLTEGPQSTRYFEMISVMKAILDKALEYKNTNFSGKAYEVVESVLDIYLDKVPEKFSYNKKEFTPVTFVKFSGFEPDDYVELTSYQAYPYYQLVDLQIPDNWSHGLYYNLPIDDLLLVINSAFEKGYSVNWDGDVGDAGFSHSDGIAIVPEDDPEKMSTENRASYTAMNEEARKKYLYRYDKPIQEKKITADLREQEFEKFITTDDHLMHLVGLAKDQNGTVYYLTKNSWGTDINEMGGNLLMSEAYVRLKTISIMVHKSIIPQAIVKKIKENQPKEIF